MGHTDEMHTNTSGNKAFLSLKKKVKQFNRTQTFPFRVATRVENCLRAFVSDRGWTDHALFLTS
jgi:hypothetical protein